VFRLDDSQVFADSLVHERLTLDAVFLEWLFTNHAAASELRLK
jgi:hypothetical protein